jgi:hypothetical protein
MYSHSVYLCWISVREGGNRGQICWGLGLEGGGDMETVETWELVISQAFVITHQVTYTTPDDNLVAEYVYVGYRSPTPDPNIVKRVVKELRKHGIYIKDLVKMQTAGCQQGESTTEEGSSA